MRLPRWLALPLVAVLLTGSALAQAESEAQPETQAATPVAAPSPTQSQDPAIQAQIQAEKQGPHHPPTKGKFVRGHWTPYEPPDPEAFPEDSRVHVIVKGDTLWDLSTQYLGDPWLWPQIWDQNRYVTDSHWIYPGDPLLIPAPPTVVAEGGEEATPQPAPPEPQAEPESKPPAGPVAVGPILQPGAPIAPQPEAGMPVLMGPELLPVADETDLYCSSYITPSVEAGPLHIVDREDENKDMLSYLDVVYLNGGIAENVVPGKEYSVMRSGEEVWHPVTQENIGMVVSSVGRVRVIAAQEHTATAIILQSCLPIFVEDWLDPFVEVPVPLSAGVPFDRYAFEAPATPDGFVIYGQGDGSEFGAGDLVEIDQGEGGSLEAGDFLTIYRDYRRASEFYSTQTIASDVTPEVLKGGHPFPLVLGQLVILQVRDRTATGKIVRSTREINIGDKVTRG